VSFDLLVGVRHHGDEQVDQHDDGDDEEHSEDGLGQWDRPPRVAAQRRQIKRVDETEQRKEEHLEVCQRSLGDRSTAAVSVAKVRHVRWRRSDRQIDGGQLEREAAEKDDQDEKEQDEVLHHLTDDDRPRTEQVMEREEVQQLDETEEHGKRVELVARVHQGQSSARVEQHRHNVDEHANCASADYYHLHR